MCRGTVEDVQMVPSAFCLEGSHVELDEEWKLSVWMGAGSTASAVVLVVLEVTAPVLIPLAIVPAAALWYVYKSSQLRLKEKDRNKYLAIGESDRMTLLFKKPE